MADNLTGDRLKRLPRGRLSVPGPRDPAVRDRLDILAADGNPKKLAVSLQRRIAGLGRGRDFVPDIRSIALAQELDHIATTIREIVLPKEPDLAFELADQFLRSDARVYDRVDDSSGAVGDVFRSTCKLWLVAASRCRTSRNWMALFQELVANDDYGVREELLPHASILFTKDLLHAMFVGYMSEARAGRHQGNRLDHEAFSASVKASQLAVALRDPRLYEDAIMAMGGELNDLQRMKIASRYLEFEDPLGAITKLSEVASTDGLDRLSLLADCYGRLGRTAEQIATLRTCFTRTLSKHTYDEILRLLPVDDNEATPTWARQTALGFTDACSTATFLFRAGWPDDGERVVIERGDEMASMSYSRLLELAELAQAAGRRIVEVVCFRHLIRDILNEVRNKAYGHAVRYYRALEMSDPLIGNYGSVGDHAAFVAELRKKHGKKYGFWGRLENMRR